MTVAVMVDGVVTVASDGTRTWAPRPRTNLTTLRELVASAVGLDETRGDVLTLKTLEFQALPIAEGTEAWHGPSGADGPVDVLSMIQTAVLAVVALVLGLFVLRPILTSASPPGPALRPQAPLALPPAGFPQRMALTVRSMPAFDIPAAFPRWAGRVGRGRGG
jgi:flagellar M-ring protein FliF